jgi:hypothetical protein
MGWDEKGKDRKSKLLYDRRLLYFIQDTDKGN